MTTKKFDVTGMTCSACSAHVEKSVRQLDGVQDVNVQLLTNTMQVTFEEAVASTSDIISAVEKGGYGASIHGEDADTAPKNEIQKQNDAGKTRLIWSIIFTVPLFYVSMGHMFSWPLPPFLLGMPNILAFAFTQFLLLLPVLIINRHFFVKGFSALFHRAPNMDSLIAIGASAAVIYGIYAIYQIGFSLGNGDMHLAHTYAMDLYFESAGMILTLITLGKFLEGRAKGKTSDAIAKMMALRPQNATIIKDGKEVIVPISEIAVGDIVAVKSGETVPVDGRIVSGNGHLNEAALTGESLPVFKENGDRVIGASINQNGYFTFRAERVGNDTTLSQIIRLMEEAGSSKAPISRLADKISGVFVPIVIAIAVLAALIWLFVTHNVAFALSIGICILVISCPCALGLATPTAIMVGTGKGAENGILIKSAEALETAHQVDTIVLDKTGTITAGEPVVTDIIAYSCEKQDLFILAASIEKQSEHPLAQAIMKKAKNEKINLKEVTDFSTVPGRGVCGKIDDSQIYAGNLSYMEQMNMDTQGILPQIDRLALEGKTPLIFARNAEIIGIIAVQDAIKEESYAAISRLKKMGLTVIMLTGDHQKTAEAIGKEVGVHRTISEVMPQDKEKQVKQLQDEGKKVVMVGDGINDAPALTRADVGIAIGAGSDIAIESADVVLVKSDLNDVPTLLDLSRATLRNIKENLFWALIYNCIGIPLAAGVFYPIWGLKLNPMFGAAAMSLSSVCVVSNALRLRFFKPRFIQENPIEKPYKEEKQMTKTLTIEGMMCAHCQQHVADALNAIDGVSATVDLESKTAIVTGDVSDDILKKAVQDAGYSVTSIA